MYNIMCHVLLNMVHTYEVSLKKLHQLTRLIALVVHIESECQTKVASLIFFNITFSLVIDTF